MFTDAQVEHCVGLSGSSACSCPPVHVGPCQALLCFLSRWRSGTFLFDPECTSLASCEIVFKKIARYLHQKDNLDQLSAATRVVHILCPFRAVDDSSFENHRPKLPSNRRLRTSPFDIHRTCHVTC